MIGIIHKDHKIIAAVPIVGQDEDKMIVVGKKIAQPGKRHSASFVTWFTDSNGTFDFPTYFTNHEATVLALRNRAVSDMFVRAGYIPPSIPLW